MKINSLTFKLSFLTLSILTSNLAFSMESPLCNGKMNAGIKGPSCCYHEEGCGDYKRDIESPINCRVSMTDNISEAIAVPVTVKDQATPDSYAEFNQKKLAAVILKGGLVMLWGDLTLNTYGDVNTMPYPIVLTQNNEMFQCFKKQ